MGERDESGKARRHWLRTALVIGLNALLAGAGLLGTYRMSEKAGLPVELSAGPGGVPVVSGPGGESPGAPAGGTSRAPAPADAQNALLPGDVILALDGRPTPSPAAAEFALDGRRIGDTVQVAFRRDGAASVADARLRPVHGAFFLTLTVLGASLCFFTGLLASLQSPDRTETLLFQGLTAALATLVLTGPGCRALPPPWLGLGLGALNAFAVSAVPVLLAATARRYPAGRGPGPVVWAPLAAVGALLATWRIAAFFQAAAGASPAPYLDAVRAGRAWFLAGLALATLLLVRSCRPAGGPARRRCLPLLLWLWPGLTAFALLRELPALAGWTPVTPVPLGVTIAVLSALGTAAAALTHRRWDISPAFNRGAVLTGLFALFLVFYAGLLAVFSVLIGDFPLPVAFSASTGAAVTAAIGFGPFREHLQRFLDRFLFTRSYQLQAAAARAAEACRLAADPDALAGELAEALKAGLPTDHASLALDLADGTTGYGEAAGLDLPVRAPGGDLLGRLIVGPRRDGEAYDEAESGFLEGVASQAGTALERIRLQESLVRGRLEAERQAELNRLKSFFVAGVSHELKTPLTGIRMFAELLVGRLAPEDRRTREYLAVIEGESARLERMVENILDAGRIERGEKHYHFAPVNLNDAVRGVLRILRYPMKMKGTTLRLRFARPDPVVRADPDALAQALVNVIANALKYSPEAPRIRIVTSRRPGEATVAVEDRGIGIAPGEVERIFTPYFRSADAEVRRRPGAGLGLSLVRHILDAHGGRVEASSRLGEGSTFTLAFPLGDPSALPRDEKLQPSMGTDVMPGRG
ncbi:MAG: PDZ domain-containing protein [Acidobacteria bacterium]|nr:PDZ domain-containing protein [Acidobacteriota bacterium]